MSKSSRKSVDRLRDSVYKETLRANRHLVKQIIRLTSVEELIDQDFIEEDDRPHIEKQRSD